MELVSAAEMRALDRAAIEDCKIPSLRLMENAGKAVVQEMERCFAPLRGKTVTVLAGKGQNGGDGFVVARILRQRGCRARVGLLWPASMLTSDATITFRKYKQAGGRTYLGFGRSLRTLDGGHIAGRERRIDRCNFRDWIERSHRRIRRRCDSGHEQGSTTDRGG